MRVFLTGATGFIGRHILDGLVRHGHEVTCLVRPGRGDRVRDRRFPGVQLVEGEFLNPGSWVDSLAGHDVVINSVGIIRSQANATFEQTHYQAPVELFDASAKHQVQKVIQISALGADAQSQSEYHLTKYRADQHLQQCGIPYIILRPSFVYGPYDSSRTFFASLAALPVTPVPGDGQFRSQPVAIDDLVRAVIAAVEDETIAHRVVDVGGAEALTFDELLDALGKWLGKRTRKIHLPWWWMRFTARITDWLGHGPITSEELGMLRRGNTADIQPFVDLFGFRPVDFSTGLARYEATWADRLRARMCWWKVPLRCSVGFIWLWTGIVSAVFPFQQSIDRLADVGITGPLAEWGLYPLCGLEVLLGLLTFAGFRIRWLGTIQIVMMVFFTMMLSLGTPELWWEPFGPLSKNIPLIGATVAMMALEE